MPNDNPPLDRNEVVKMVREVVSLLSETPSLPVCLEPPTVPTNPEWRWLSQAEQSIVDALKDGPLAAEPLARKCGEQFSSRFRTLLANLVDRRVLEVTRDGYAVNLPPASASPH